MKNFNIMGVHWKIQFLERSRKTNIYCLEIALKGEGLDSLQI